MKIWNCNLEHSKGKADCNLLSTSGLIYTNIHVHMDVYIAEKLYYLLVM